MVGIGAFHAHGCVHYSTGAWQRPTGMPFNGDILAARTGGEGFEPDQVSTERGPVGVPLTQEGTMRYEVFLW